MKLKKNFFVPIIVILCIVVYVCFSKPAIEKKTWLLSYAQQATPPLFVVAHHDDYDFSDDDSSLFEFSKPIELTLEAADGQLILTDITHGKTYEGSYKNTSWRKQSYSVTLEGLEGHANISSQFGRTLFVSIGDYYLHFEAK